MPMFKLKSPDMFPWPLHEAFRRALRAFIDDPELTRLELTLELGINADTAKDKPKKRTKSGWEVKTPERLIVVEQKRVVAFKSMIKRHPFHPHNELLQMASVRAIPELFKDGWGLRLTFNRTSRIHECFQVALSK